MSWGKKRTYFQNQVSPKELFVSIGFDTNILSTLTYSNLLARNKDKCMYVYLYIGIQFKRIMQNKYDFINKKYETGNKFSLNTYPIKGLDGIQKKNYSWIVFSMCSNEVKIVSKMQCDWIIEWWNMNLETGVRNNYISSRCKETEHYKIHKLI